MTRRPFADAAAVLAWCALLAYAVAGIAYGVTLQTVAVALLAADLADHRRH